MKFKQVEVDGKVIYLKKNLLGGYREVYPWKNEDGSFNWFNLLTGGTWGKLISLVLIILAILISAYFYNHDISSCKSLIECGATCPKEIFNPKYILNLTLP